MMTPNAIKRYTAHQTVTFSNLTWTHLQIGVTSTIHFSRHPSVTLSDSCQTLEHLKENFIALMAVKFPKATLIEISNMSWSSHYDYIVSKAYRALGLLRRSLYHTNSVTIKKITYLHIVRSCLLCCSQASSSSPHHTCRKNTTASFQIHSLWTTNLIDILKSSSPNVYL